MARNQTDWTNLDAETVDAVHEDLAISTPIYGDGSTQYEAGDVVTISSASDDGSTIVMHASNNGGVVTHIIRTDSEDPYGALAAYVLQPGHELVIPPDAIAHNVVVTPGDHLIAQTDGKLKLRSAASNYVVFKALTDNLDDFVRVITICSETPS